MKAPFFVSLQPQPNRQTYEGRVKPLLMADGDRPRLTGKASCVYELLEAPFGQRP